MIMVMENAALNAIRAYLDPGESAVGTAVNVRHVAATPVGRLVTGEAEVTKVDGRQIKFTVRATEVRQHPHHVGFGHPLGGSRLLCFVQVAEIATPETEAAPFLSTAALTQFDMIKTIYY
jgi:acyl-coenzyme A thioesterase PaaI-like protein